MATPKVLLKRSSVAGRVPTAGDLQYGELAINFQDGKIYYKDASNNIKAFVDSARVQAIADAVEVVAESQLDSSEVTNLIDSDYISNRVDASLFLDSAEAIALIDSAYIRGKIDGAFISSLTNVDADTLGGQLPNYFNNYTNITNKPNILDSANVIDLVNANSTDSAAILGIVDSAYIKNIADSDYIKTVGGIDADTLGGNAGSYYRNYNNLTNTPTVLDLVDITNHVDSNYVQARAAGGSNTQVLFNNNGTVAGDPQMVFNPSTNRLTVDKLTATTNLSLGGSGSQFFAFNEDTVKVKFANWYSSNDRQYGQGQLWYELFFAAVDSSDTADNRRIGFYLDKPNAGASDADGGTGTHPTNPRMYIDVDKVYIDSNLQVSGDVTADNLKVVDSAGVTSIIDSAYIQPRARKSISGGTGINYDNVTGEIAVDSGSTVVVTQITTNTGIADHIDFTGVKPAHKEGRIFYDSAWGALGVYNDEADITLQVGQEEYIRVYNNTASTITNGTPVYLSGENNDIPTIDIADASDPDKYEVVGLVTHDIEASTYGYVTTRGLVGDINTAHLTAGERVHLGFATPGTLVQNAPDYPNYPMDIGLALVIDANTGCVYVDVQSHTFEKFRATGNARVDGNFTVGGNLNIIGTETKTSVTSLEVADQFVYVGGGDTISTPTYTGSGLNDVTFKGHYKGDSNVSYYVRISDDQASHDKIQWSFDSDFATLQGFESAGGATEFTLDSANTLVALRYGVSVQFEAANGHDSGDIWEGAAAPTNVDFGFSGNWNDSANPYTHAGFFRDADDNRFKFFNKYNPEPEGIIDVGHSSFEYGEVQASRFHGNLTGNVTGTVSDISNHSTTDLSEGTNQYFTTARANSAIDTRVDSAYVQARQTPVKDSGFVTGIIDSAYINARASSFDSANATGLIDSAYITARASTFDSANATGLIDSAYVQARQADGTDSAATVAIIDSHVNQTFVNNLDVDAATLGGNDSTYYLDYNNFTSTPTIPTVDKTTIDALNINADQVDGQHGAYYLNYNNFTNTPSILDSNEIKNIFNTSGDAQLETERVVGLEYLEFIHDSDVTTFLVEVDMKTDAHRYYNDGSSNGYVIRNQQSPFLQFVPGNKYRFDQSNGTNVGHPIRFYYDVDKTTQYSDNVTAVGTPGSAGAYTEIEITDATPAVLHYQCTAHGKMGNAIFVQTRNLTGYDTDDLTEGTSNLYYTDSRVSSHVDSAYVAQRQDYSWSNITGVPKLIDSGLVTQLIDSAYIAARESGTGTGAGGLDSAAVINLVDSAYVQLREAAGAGGANLAFKNVAVNGQDTLVADGAADTLTFEAGSNITLTTDANTDTITIASTGGGGGGVASGLTLTKWITKADSGQRIFTGADSSGDSLYYDPLKTQVNVYLNGVLLVDSDDFTMTDSSTITLIDSANLNDVVQIIKYTPPEAGGGSGTVDSAQTISLIKATVDSSYVENRQTIFERGTLEVNKFFFDADSGDTTFSGNDKFNKLFSVDADNTEVYLNGILQELTTDYTIDSDSVTFTEALDSGYSVSVIETIGRVNTASTLIKNSFEFDADSGQTVFSGSDRDGVTLDISQGTVSVFLNGILLSPFNDYTQTTSSITLIDSADSGDFLSIINDKGVVVSTQNVSEVVFTNTTGTTLSGNNLAYSGNILLFKNGDILRKGTDYTANNGTSITLTTAAIASDTFVVHTFGTTDLQAKVYDFVATEGQTTFEGDDRFGNALKYNTGETIVYQNGIALVDSADYTATNGTSVVFTSGVSVDDEIKIVTYIPASLSSIATDLKMLTYEYTATASQTVFSGADDNGETLSYSSGKENVFLNGLKLKSSDYTATNGTSVTLTVAADSGDILAVQTFNGNNIGIDSGQVTGLIDATYVQGKVTESFLEGIIDSDYVSSRQSNAATWEEQASSVTLVANTKNIVDCSSSAINLTLPATPSLGDEIRVIDGTGNASTNNIVLLRNGNNIQGAADNLTIDVDRAGIGLVYYNATNGWILIEN